MIVNVAFRLSGLLITFIFFTSSNIQYNCGPLSKASFYYVKKIIKKNLCLIAKA